MTSDCSRWWSLFGSLEVIKGRTRENAQRVVGGDEKRSLKSQTVKYGLKSQGTRSQERLRWQGPAAYKKDRPVLS
jgi:hypothetical protein